MPQKEEMANKKAYEELKAAKEEQIATGKAQIDTKTQELGDALSKRVWQSLMGAPSDLVRQACLAASMMLFALAGYAFPVCCADAATETPLTSALAGAWFGFQTILQGFVNKYAMAAPANQVKSMIIWNASFFSVVVAYAYEFWDKSGTDKQCDYVHITLLASCAFYLVLAIDIVAMTKIHLNNWWPKRHSFVCVWGGLTKHNARLLMPHAMLSLFAGFFGQSWLDLDSIFVASNKSIGMRGFRPTAFFFLRKGYYHFYAYYADTCRHPIDIVLKMYRVCLIVGGLGALMLKKTRTWLDLSALLLSGWLIVASRFWMLGGSPHGQACRITRAVVWFLKAGKPIPTKHMELLDLRAFEVLAQSQASVICLIAIVSLYPVCLVIGEQSVIFKVFFPREHSLQFVFIAAANELVIGIITKMFVWRGRNCSFDKYFSLKSICMIPCGIIVLRSAYQWHKFVWSGWQYSNQDVWPFEEKAE